MTIQWGDTGRVAFGPLKSFSITLHPNENLVASTQNLGTSAPTGGAAGDISYTIQSSDLPTIAPSPISTQYTAHMILTGQNNSGSSGTINYNILKNGTSVASNQTYTGIPSTNYWSLTHYRWSGVVVGDTLEVQTWASATGFTLLYGALIIYPRQLQLSNANIIKDVNFILTTPTLTATGQNPSAAITQGWNVYPTSLSSLPIAANSNFTMTAGNFNNSTLLYFGRPAYDSPGASYPNGSSTYHPYYARCYYPSQITFREVLR